MTPRLAASSLVLVSLLYGTVLLARNDIEDPASFGRYPEGILALWPPNLFSHDAGRLSLEITNIGQFGNPRNDNLNAGWRGGEYLYQSGLWIGAVGSDSEPHVSTSIPSEFRPLLSASWTIYESFEGIKSGRREGALDGGTADDDGDAYAGGVLVFPEKVDEDFHNGLDDDGDGAVDEDFAAVGQQMYSCMYRDDTPESVSGNAEHFPLNLLIRQRSFQWSTESVDEFVGIDFEILNDGDQRLREIYLAFFSDTDAGPPTAASFWNDDLVGWSHIDTMIVDANTSGPCSMLELQIDAAYMWDAPDNGTSVTGGDVSGVFGSLFLGHSTDDTGIRAPQNVGLSTVAWFSSSGENADPRDDDERYQLISNGMKPARPATRPDDYRYVIAAGPFSQLDPGESLVFQTAYVIGEGQDGFRRNAVNAQRVFNGRFVDGDQNPDTGLDGKERCLRALDPGDQVVWNDPCDSLATTITHRSSQCLWVDADCNACSGVGGAETLVNWVGTVAPPAPGKNTDPTLDPIRDPTLKAFVAPAGDRKVVLQWDNSSELGKDPITGVSLFEGYRVWRADNWQRPEGAIGPSSEEWMKVAEFRIHPESSGETGASHLRFATNRSVLSVGVTDDGQEIYPIGRYQYEDSLGIINGKVYFYTVTAFGLLPRLDPITGLMTVLELSSQPSAVEAEAIVPRWDAVEGGCDQVKVVPNPYRGGAAWDLIPADHDPTGTKLAFANLSQGFNTIRIYTLAGDLVQEIFHDGRTGDGTYYWNMVTRNGQNITSGVYLYSVEADGGDTCRKRFVVIR